MLKGPFTVGHFEGLPTFAKRTGPFTSKVLRAGKVAKKERGGPGALGGWAVHFVAAMRLDAWQLCKRNGSQRGPHSIP